MLVSISSTIQVMNRMTMDSCTKVLNMCEGNIWPPVNGITMSLHIGMVLILTLNNFISYLRLNLNIIAKINFQIVRPTKWNILIILGYVPLSAGACGGNDQYDTSGLTLDECMENCIQRDDCSAVAFKEKSCGIHQGAIKITSGGWTKGYSCYEKHRKISDNLSPVTFSV